MKSFHRFFAIAAAAAFLAVPALAGECCNVAATKVKAGEACEKCVDHACCKEAARKTSKELAASGGKAAECKTCAAKAKGGKKSS